MNLLLVALGSALGGMLRYGLAVLCVRLFGPGFPVGTVLANLLGCCAMGMLAGYLGRIGPWDGLRLFAGVGVLGGFTTFSSFSLDVFNLSGRGEYAQAAGYVLGSIGLGLAGFWLGREWIR